MRSKTLALPFLLLILGCASAPGLGAAPPDPDGNRFLCGAQDSRSLCLPVVRGECAVRFVEGESIPAEAEERVVVRRASGEEVRVNSPSDLAGCVHLESAAEVLEYLRLFSSFSTVHLFEPQRLEIFPASSGPACRFTCVSPRVWRKLRLADPSVTSLGDGSFQVTRSVIKPLPQPWMPTLYRLTERVTQDGTVEILSEVPVPAHREDLAGLTFPMYL
jgi:hypothetical protein